MILKNIEIHAMTHLENVEEISELIKNKINKSFPNMNHYFITTFNEEEGKVILTFPTINKTLLKKITKRLLQGDKPYTTSVIIYDVKIIGGK